MRVYGSLGDFLPEPRRGVAFACEVGEPRAAKDLIESLGVPHCEVFLVLVDGQSAGLDRVVAGGERIAVYPHFSEIDAAGCVTAGEPLPQDPRFVLDGHLGRLAAWLRALGLDTAHDRAADDAAIAEVSAREDRVLLTRDVGLLKRSLVRHGWFVRATDPAVQLAQVVRRFRLDGRTAPFSRCLRCNTPLTDISREDLGRRAPARVQERFSVFRACPGCRRVYWPGTHHDRLTRLLVPYVRSAPRGSHS